jgi:hypothetical protein
MPWLPIYADSNDFRVIHDWLNASEELAFIVADGPGRWRAVRSIPVLENDLICLWHVPSGPLPLLHASPSRKVSSITDPWSGWEELRTGVIRSTPYFGAGHPGIIWLNFHPVSQRSSQNIGLSSFEWVGNHYRIIGKSADPLTETLWRSLRRWVQKRAQRIPRSGPLDGPRAEIYALPSALAAFESGVGRDVNPEPTRAGPLV